MDSTPDDNDDDNPLVTSASLSSDLGDVWKNLYVDDPDWEEVIYLPKMENERVSSSADEASHGRALWTELQSFLDSHDVLKMRTSANK